MVFWVLPYLSFFLSASNARPPITCLPSATYIFTAPTCTATIIPFEHCALNAEFQYFITLRILLNRGLRGWKEAQIQGEFMDFSIVKFWKGNHTLLFFYPTKIWQFCRTKKLKIEHIGPLLCSTNKTPVSNQSILELLNSKNDNLCKHFVSKQCIIPIHVGFLKLHTWIFIFKPIACNKHVKD